MMVLRFDESPEFRRDVKKLAKKWHSIPDDISLAKVALTPLYVRIDDMSEDKFSEFRKSFFATKRATIVAANDECEVVKMRLDCASLGNDKKLRLVVVAVMSEGKMIFVELFAKNDKDREDPSRYRSYL